MPTIINVEHLSKQYRIGAPMRHNSFRDIFDEKVKSILNFAKRKEAKKESTIWALQDVSFDVEEGEVLGIIGRNGAGKSTLLKILSRITEPTKGSVRMRGRVASLLEVGTGFSGELTGRENIFLNGAILGMKKAEIDRKFDEIVAFAEVEKFIDTPVKYYSSGMYMRLAFAVAAHLEPEILVVDEVLAVGDAQFQKKCLGKMKDISSLGRTVLFVSHNMKAVRQLCSRAILLRVGSLIADGSSFDITEKYLHEDAPSPDTVANIQQLLATLAPDDALQWRDIRLSQGRTLVEHAVANGSPLEITISYRILQRTTGLRIFCDIVDTEETLLFRSFHDENAEGIPTMEPGEYVSTAIIPEDILAPVNYELIIRAGIHNVRPCLPVNGIRIPISVEATGRYNRAYLGDTHRGKLGIALEWKTTRTKDAAV